MRKSRQVSNHGNRTLAPRRRSSCSDPVQSHQAVAHLLEYNHRIRPKIGKVWAKIATAIMARSPATRWRYVRGHMSAVIVTLVQHNWTPVRGEGCKARVEHRLGGRGRSHHAVQARHVFGEKKKGRHAARGMLVAAATASCWTQERRYRAGLVETPRCPRCEEEDEDMHHRV